MKKNGKIFVKSNLKKIFLFIDIYNFSSKCNPNFVCERSSIKKKEKILSGAIKIQDDFFHFFALISFNWLVGGG